VLKATVILILLNVSTSVHAQPTSTCLQLRLDKPANSVGPFSEIFSFILAA